MIVVVAAIVVPDPSEREVIFVAEADASGDGDERAADARDAGDAHRRDRGGVDAHAEDGAVDDQNAALAPCVEVRDVVRDGGAVGPGVSKRRRVGGGGGGRPGTTAAALARLRERRAEAPEGAAEGLVRGARQRLRAQGRGERDLDRCLLYTSDAADE